MDRIPFSQCMQNLWMLLGIVNSAMTVTPCRSIYIIQEIDSIESTIQNLYLPEVLANPNKCIQSSFLSPLNQQVDEYKNTILDLLPGEGCTHAVKCQCSLIPLLTLV